MSTSLQLVKDQSIQSRIKTELADNWPLESRERLEALNSKKIPLEHVDVSKLDTSTGRIQKIVRISKSNSKTKVLKFDNGQTLKVNSEQNFKTGQLVEVSSTNIKVVYPYYLCPAYRKHHTWLYLTFHRGVPSCFYIDSEQNIYYTRHRFRMDLYKQRLIFEGVLVDGYFLVTDLLKNTKAKTAQLKNLIETRQQIAGYLQRDYQPDPIFEHLRVKLMPMVLAQHYSSFVSKLNCGELDIPYPDGLALRPIKRDQRVTYLMAIPKYHSTRDGENQIIYSEWDTDKQLKVQLTYSDNINTSMTDDRTQGRPDCYWISYKGSEPKLLAVPDIETSRKLSTLTVESTDESIEITVNYSAELDAWIPINL